MCVGNGPQRGNGPATPRGASMEGPLNRTTRNLTSVSWLVFQAWFQSSENAIQREAVYAAPQDTLWAMSKH